MKISNSIVESRVQPVQDKVFIPGDNKVFVFGSNEAGRHGKGAAKYARDYLGAIYGKGRGLMGSCYAIPTKNKSLKTLPLVQIQQYITEFIAFAKENTVLQFFVTRIGCGLAGYKDEDIIPMFRNAPDNCELPEGWRNVK